MPFEITPFIDLDEAIVLLESHGVYGAVKKDDGSLRLFKRKSKRIDPKTGAEISFCPEDLMTPDIRKKLTNSGWRIVHSSAHKFQRHGGP